MRGKHVELVIDYKILTMRNSICAPSKTKQLIFGSHVTKTSGEMTEGSLSSSDFSQISEITKPSSDPIVIVVVLDPWNKNYLSK